KCADVERAIFLADLAQARQAADADERRRIDQRPPQQDRHRRRAGDNAAFVAVLLQQRHCCSRCAWPSKSSGVGTVERRSPRGGRLDATYQAIDDQQGNALGRLRGSDAGPDLLLYAPTDTAFSGDADEELPWMGSSVRADLAPAGFRDGDYVVGLGAENPKAY